MSEVKQGFLAGFTGERSSKRLWGSILMTVTLIMGAVLFVFAMLADVHDSNVSMKVIELFLGSGCLLLGLGLVERFGKK